MKIIKPVKLTDSNIVSSNTVEDHPLWVVSTTYSENDVVISGNFIYRSLINDNIGNEPNPDPNITATNEWFREGPSNRWAMFDNSVSTQSTSPTDLIVEVNAGVVTGGLGLLNISGSKLIVEMTDPVDGLVYHKEIVLESSIVLNWLMYFTQPFVPTKDVVLLDLPLYSQATIKITIEGVNTAIGSMIIGTPYEFGHLQYGVGFGIRDYSIKDTDSFGRTIFVERNFAKRVNALVMIDNTEYNFVTQLLSDIRATPTVFIPTEDDRFSSMITFGFLRDWNIEIPYPFESLLRVEIIGLT